MAKRAVKRRSLKAEERKTNWLLIGGIIGVGVVGLFGLLFASLQGSGPPTPALTATPSFVLEDYCTANPGNCIVDGAADAPITVVEVSDYGCGHCANFNLNSADILKAQYVDSGQVRWITVPYALGGQTGYPTLPSSSAALCANEQGQFEPFHKALFANQGTSRFNTRDGFLDAASTLGLDVEAFAACIDDGRYQATIASNIQAASLSGINSTPTFFVNGEMVLGNLPVANFQQLLNAQLGS